MSVNIEEMSIDEALAALGESTRVEVHDGAIVVNPPRTAAHQRAVHQIVDWLAARYPDHWVLTGVGIWLGSEQRYIPDVAVITPLDPDVPEDDWKHPELFQLVVEVLSPSTRRADLGLKREHYHRARLAYWIVDPEQRSIERSDDTTGLDVNELAAALWGDE